MEFGGGVIVISLIDGNKIYRISKIFYFFIYVSLFSPFKGTRRQRGKEMQKNPKTKQLFEKGKYYEMVYFKGFFTFLAKLFLFYAKNLTR